LQTNEKGNAEYCQAPAAAQMTVAVEEKIVSFHCGRRILALAVRSEAVECSGFDSR
jgi:hypothetical protein